MTLPVTITGISTAVAPVGPFKVAAGSGYVSAAIDTGAVVTGGNSMQGGTSSFAAAGQSFTNGASSLVIPSIIANFHKTGSPTDNIYAEITQTDINGTVLATSSNVAAATITGTSAATSTGITFTFPSPPTISASATFAIRFWRTSADTSNYPTLSTQVSSNPYAGGSAYLYNGSTTTWGTTSSDAKIIVNGTITLASDAYYFFGRDGTTATTLQAFKSTAPDTSWASVTSKTGFTTALLNIAAYQSGHVIHLAVQDGTLATSVATKYLSFDASSDSFLASTETVVAASNIAGQSTSGWGCSLVVRSSGEVVIFYNNTQTNTSGTARARLHYRRRTGLNTYATSVQVDPNTATESTSPLIALGASDRLHLLFFNGTNTMQRHLTSANVLGTSASTGATALPQDVDTRNDGGTIRFVGLTAASAFRWSSADNPSVTNAAVTLGTPVRATDDNSLIYALHQKSADSDLYVNTSTNSGASWGGEVSAFTGTVTAAAASLSKNQLIYQRDSNYVIPYIVNDGGTLKYNEYVVRSSADNKVLVADGGTPWTPANLAVAPKVILDGATVAWSGSNFGTTANAGTLGGNIVAAQGTVTKGATFKGFDTLNFSGAQTLQITSKTWTSGDNVSLFAVGIFNRSLCLYAHKWEDLASGIAIFPRMSSTATIAGGHTYALDDLQALGSGFNETTHTLSTGMSASTRLFFMKMGTAVDVNHDGTDHTDVARSTTGSIPAIASGPITIGGSAFSQEYFNGQIAYMAVLVDPTTDEIQQLEGWAAHKYGVAARLPGGHPYKYAPPTTGGSAAAYTLTGATAALTKGTGGLVNKTLPADAGSYALTGTAAAILLKRKIDATTGASYSLTGSDAALIKRVHKRLTADAGSYALTGAATTSLLHLWKLPAIGSSYALTGSDAALTKGTALVNKTLPADGSSYSLTGTDAALIKRVYKVLAAEAGAYLLTGSTTPVLHKWKMAALAGSYSLTGSDAVVTKFANKRLTAEAGSYALSGTPATIRPAKKIDAATGAYTLTGAATTAVLLKRRLTASGSSYALSGADVGFQIRTDKFLSAATGSYSLSGSAANVLHRYKPVALPGSYALTGNDAALIKRTHRVLAALGSAYALSGVSAAVLLRRKLAALGGSYSLTGSAATLRHIAKVTAAGGSYALSGTPASLLHRGKLTALPGAYALSGTAAAVAYGRKLAAPGASYALSGSAASFAKTEVLQAGAGAYALTGTPALVKYFWTLHADGGSYAVTGTPATLRRARTLPAAAGAYALTGSSAIITQVRLLYLDAAPGSYSLTGHVARLFVGVPALSDRTVVVKGEDRIAETLVELRTVAALADNRLVRVAAESRSVDALTENRSIEVQGESHGVPEMV